MQFCTEKVGTKFVFPNQEGIDEDKKAWVEIRPLSNSKLREVMSACSRQQVGLKVMDGEKQPRQVTWTEINDDLMYEMIWDWVIVAWGNIEVDNKTLACTKENKLAVMGNDEFFASNVITWRESIEESLVELVEVLRKNSSTTSKDSMISPPVVLVGKSGN